MANGLYGGGLGTKDSPYLVEDAMDLHNIRFKPSVSYKLVRDINLSEPPFDKMGWKPIPFFDGTLDGNEHSIYALRIEESAKNNIGLFGKVSWNFEQNLPVIQRLSIENAKVSGNGNVGILAGTVQIINHTKKDTDVANQAFSMIHVSGNVSGVTNLGGLIGTIDMDFKEDNESVLLSDISIDAIIKPVRADIAKGGWIVGCLKGEKGTVKLTDSVLTGKCDTETAALGMHSIASADTPGKYSVAGCYYCIENIVPDKAYGISLSKDEIVRRENFESLDLKGVTAKHLTWKFVKENSPKLWFTQEKYFLVKGEHDWFTYHDNAWEKKFSATPTMDEAIKYGITDISTVKEQVWSDVKKKQSKIDLMCYSKNSNGLDNSYLSKNMMRKKEIEKENTKQKYNYAFSFDDIGLGSFDFDSKK